MPEELTPITREETYLAAIAGEDVSVPDPVIRKEEFLAAIDGHVGDVESAVANLESAGEALASVVQDLRDIVPAPAASDSGKVLTAGADGTASWETPSGGGGVSGVPSIKVPTFPPREETVSGHEFNSSTTRLYYAYDGQGTWMNAGTYFFVDFDDYPAPVAIYDLKHGQSQYNAYQLEEDDEQQTADTSVAGTGFCLAPGTEVRVIYLPSSVLVDDTYYLIDRDAVITYV